MLSGNRADGFRPITWPDGVLGHFGFARSAEGGDPYVWAVMDRNSRYAVGLTVDRDGDGVPNSADNCIGTPNSEPDQHGCDRRRRRLRPDDDDDTVLDAATTVR